MKALRIAGMVAVPAVIIAAFSYGIYLHREFQSKAEWSVLQAADLNNRQSADRSNLLLASDGPYHLAGVINTGQKQSLSPAPKVDRAWILLDPKYPPVVKILAAEGTNFAISRAEFDKVMAYASVNPEVASVLRNHIR